MVRYLLLTLLLIAMQVTPVLASGMGPAIRVGLVVNQFSAELSSGGGIKVLAAKGKTIILSPGRHFVSVKKGLLQVDNSIVGGSSVSFLSANPKFPVDVNRKHYRGAIRATLNSNKKTLNIINSLPLEEYLYGVVAKEIIPLWPDEAIKAQAVASRSFALNKINSSHYLGYDVRANEMGQIYGGILAEHDNTNKMIETTRGVVAVYNGRPIEAFFHSCSGGYTESSENVWGSPIPYLKAVKDYDQDAPQFSWEKIYTRDQLQRQLAQAGFNVGTLTSIRLSYRKAAPMQAIDRGISGRVKNITFSGNKGNVTIAGTKLRSILHLNSTLFDIYVGLKRPDYIEVPILNQFGMEIGKKRIPIKTNNKGRDAYTGSMGEVRLLTSVTGERIFIAGNGWGHGLGMSQWGARGMALAAPKKSKDYYQQILQHYYTGIQIKKIY